MRDGLVAGDAKRAVDTSRGRDRRRRLNGVHCGLYTGRQIAPAARRLDPSRTGCANYTASLDDRQRPPPSSRPSQRVRMLDFVQLVSDQMAPHRRPRRGLAPLGRRRDPRVGHQRHQARQRRTPTSASSSNSRSCRRDRPRARRQRSGTRAKDSSPRKWPIRSPREHAQVERPRHLLHAQLHGRCRRCDGCRKAAWKCGWSKRC